MHWYKYQRLGTIYAYMHRLQLEFPHLVEVLTIGKTDQGRDILLAKVGKTNSIYPKKAIFIEAGKYQMFGKISQIFRHKFIGLSLLTKFYCHVLIYKEFTQENGYLQQLQLIFSWNWLKTIM